jgi:hypothetical protein
MQNTIDITTFGAGKDQSEHCTIEFTDALDTVDAALFTGPYPETQADADTLEYFLGRWLRRLQEFRTEEQEG